MEKKNLDRGLNQPEDRKVYGKTSNKSARKPMRDEYNFSQGRHGKYVRRYVQGANVVVLKADVAKVFSNSKSVNVSLRRIIRPHAHKLAK